MKKPVALIGHQHTCPMVDPGPKPHVGGPVMDGVPFVRVNGMLVATVGSKCTCSGPPDTIAAGSTLVKVNGKAVARMGDSTVHGGVLVQGDPGVLLE